MCRLPSLALCDNALVVAFLSLFAFNALGALAAGPSFARKAAALALSAVPYAVALAFPPEDALLRASVWVGAMFLTMRMLDVFAEARRPPAFRLGLMLCVLDLRTLRRERGFPTSLAARTLAYTALAALAFATLPLWPRPFQWLGGAACLYVGMEAADAIVRLPLRLGGFALRPLQHSPIRSRSLGEFWGRRWNREVSGLLSRWCFRPLARRGHAGLGLAWAFTCSGLFHAISVLSAAGWWDALTVLLFFMLHGALVSAERTMGIARWPAWAAHGWVVGAFAVTGPLFLDPVLRIFLLA